MKTKILLFLCWVTLGFGQRTPIPDPYQTPLNFEGFLNTVFDGYGNQYSLEDIMINKNDQSTMKWIDQSCDSGIFNLNFTNGSGFEDPTNATQIARRAVICQVFKDLSNFINSPLHNTGNTQKVEIWVRDIDGLISPADPSSTNVLGMASGFYVRPIPPTSPTVNGGIIDNEIWKTIHTGSDSYIGVAAPLVSSAYSGSFYHGQVAINFSNLSNNWNLNTSINCPNGQLDLYSVILHEVTHALGFASLINEQGQSKLGTNFPYFTRYDTFLQSSNGQFLLSNGSCNPMYDNNFIGNAASLHPGCISSNGIGLSNSDITNCENTIRYFGPTQIIPVYTPQCYETDRSLSHFEDMCYNNPYGFPNGNNNYFTMSNINGYGVTKRHLTTEERQTLCDIGYALKNNYATGSFNAFNYPTGSCSGIQIAGVNDGIAYGGNFTIIGDGTIANPIIIPINGVDGILVNDFNGITGSTNDIRIECLQDVYDNTSLINGSTSPYSSTSFVNSVTFTSNNIGTHLLRYIPIVNGVRGNITYVYVNITLTINNFNCNSPNACNIVNNGTFEVATVAGPLNNTTLSCWNKLKGSPDLYARNLGGTGSFTTGTDTMGNQPATDSYNGAPNDNFVGIWAQSPTASESVQTLLNTPLVGGQDYILSFWAKANNGFSFYDTPNENWNINSSLAFFSTPFINAVPSGLVLQNINNFTTDYPNSQQLSQVIIPPNNDLNGNPEWTYYSIPFTFPSGTPDHNCLIILKGDYIPGYPQQEVYTLIDDISIIPVNQITYLSIPSNVCSGETISNLDNYLSPAPIGGTFSGIGVSGNSFTTNTPGTYTINYTYTNSNGCSIAIADTIEILDCNNIIIPLFPEFGPYCLGDTPISLPFVSTNGINGVWNPASIDTSVAGTFVYTFTPDFGQNAQVVTIPIVITEPTIPIFDFQNTNICQGSSFPLPVNDANGILGHWELVNNPGVSVNQINTNSIGNIDYIFVPSIDCILSTSLTFVIVECIPPVLVGEEVSCEETEPKNNNYPGEDDIIDGTCMRVCENSIIEYHLTGNTALVLNTQWNITGGIKISSNDLYCEIEWNGSMVSHIQAIVTLDTAPPFNIVTIDRCVEKISAPKALFTINPFNENDYVYSCVKTPLYFTNLSTAGDGNGELYYLWDFGDGNTSTEFEPTYTYNQMGTYTVTLTVTNGCSCTDVYEKKINIDKGVNIVECPSVVCEGQIASYRGSSDCKTIYTTLDGQITNQDGYNVTVIWDNIDESGFGTLIMQPEDEECGKCTATLKIPVVQTQGTIKGPSTICIGNQSLFSLPQWPTTDFEWHIEDVTGDGELVWNNQRNEIIIEAIKPGEVILSCEYYNTLLGCGGMAEMIIKILPEVYLSPTDFVCIGNSQNFQFLDATSNPVSVNYAVYEPNNSTPILMGTNSQFNLTPTVVGFYTVDITSPNVCATIPMEIKVIDGIDPTPHINGPQNVCPGTPYTFTATNNPIITNANIIWSVTDGNFVGSNTGSSVQVIFNTTATPPYTLNAFYEKNGCVSAVAEYHVQPINIDFGFDLPIPNGVCGSSTQTYSIVTLPSSNVNIDNLDYINWSIVPSNAGSIVAGLNAQSVTVNWNNNAGTALLKVNVRSCGVESFIEETITINNAVPVTLYASDNVVCANSTVTFNLTGLTSFDEIEWNFGDGNTETINGISPYSFDAINTFQNVAITNSYTVTATIKKPNGCTNPVVVSIPITVMPTPVVELDKKPYLNLCNVNNQTADFNYTIPTQSGWAGTVAIQWYHNGGIIPGATAQNYSIPIPNGNSIQAANVIGTYYAMVTNQVVVGNETYHCIGYSEAIEVVNSCTTGGNCTTNNDITFSNSIGCNTVTYTANPDGTPDQVNFYFPFNPSLSVFDTTAPYNAAFSNLNPGEYIVKIDAQGSDPDVCWEEELTSFIIPYRADLKFEISCNNGAYNITLLDHSLFYDDGNGSPINNYEFKILDGSTVIASQTISSPVSLPAINQATFTNIPPGDYDYSITISGGGYAPCTFVSANNILPAITPVTGFTITNMDGTPVNAICEGEPVQLTPKNGSLPATCNDCTYQWQFDPDGSINTSQSPIKTFDFDNGNSQDIFLTVTNANGCEAFYSTSIEVYEIDIVGALIPDKTTACLGETVTLSYNLSSGQIPASLDWFYNTVNNPLGSGSTMPVTEPGYYFAYGYTANGCREAIAINPVNVSFIPIKTPIINGEDSVCSGSSISLNVTQDTNTTYEWTVTNSTDSTVDILSGNTINYQPSYTGTYTFSVVAKSGNCFSNAATYTVLVRETPNIPNIQFDLINCNPYTVNAWVSNPQPNVVYNWSNGAIGTNTILNHDGPLQVRAELLGCSQTNQIDLPVDLNSHRWIFPFGCFKFCYTNFDLGYILGPLDELEWYWIFNGIDYSSGVDWVPTSDVVQSGSYELLLKDDDCELTLGTADINITECRPCEVSLIEITKIACEEINGQLVYSVEFIFENATGTYLTTTLTTPNGEGYFSPSTITLIPGTNIYNGYFVPGTNFTNGNTVPLALIITDGIEIDCMVTMEINMNCELGGKLASVKDKIAMAPNPATNTTTIWHELLNKGAVKLLVTDATGRVIYEMEHQENEGQFTIDVTHLPKGYYPVKVIQNGETVYSDKLLKN